MRHKKDCIDCSRRQAERVFTLAIRDPKIRSALEGDPELLREQIGRRAIEIVTAASPESSPAEVSFWAILKAKCPVIAQSLGVEMYDAALVRRSR